MTGEEQVPDVDEIKERLKVEIPVEEEPTKPPPDIAAELKSLGQQFAETLQTVWHSEERQRVEAEFREGMRSFADEVDKVVREVRFTPAAQKMKDEAGEVRERVESGEIGRKARGGFVQGLQWLSDELGKLAEQFTPVEKSPEEGEV